MSDDARLLSELTVGEAKGLIKSGVWYAVKLWLLFVIGFPILCFGLLAVFGYILYPK